VIKKTTLAIAAALVVAACSPTPAPPATTTTSVTSSSTTTTTPIDYVAYVEDALDFMEVNHYRTDEVDWETVRPQTLAIVEANPTAIGAYGAIATALLPTRTNTVVPDAHTWFWRPEQVAERNSPEYVVSSDPPTGRRLSNDLGYLNLPSVGTGSDQRATYASQIQDLMADVDSGAPVCGWIIDLRGHTGGDAGVGWAGLGPLLGDDVFFRFVGNHEIIEVSYRDGALLYDGEPVTDFIGEGARYVVTDGYLPEDGEAPIAVLTSVSTGSAGEAILVSFLGRPDTRVFGEPTTGIPTAGNRLEMPDGAELRVTAFRYQDRLGRTYDESIRPDETILMNPGTENDEAVEVASQWLLETSSCDR